MSRSAQCSALVLACCAAFASARPAEEGSLPYSLAVEVVWGEPRGPDSVRDEIRRQVVHDVDARGWFEEIVEYDENREPPTDLLLYVTLDQLRTETHYATSMAARQEADDPISKQQFVVEWSVLVTTDLFAMPEGVAVRSSRFRETNSRKPRYLGEDTDRAVREEAIRDVSRSIRKAAFRGSLEKLDRRIERVRAEAGTPSR